MRPLTNEEIQKELNDFPRLGLNYSAKKRIAASLERIDSPIVKKKKLFPAALSFAVLALLFIGISTFVINSISGNGLFFGLGSAPAEKFSIDPMDKFTIERIADDEVEFYVDGKKAGGIEIMTEAEMHKNIAKQNLFENNVLPGFQYPVRWTLDHQKTMEAVQIRHYFFLSEKSKLRYHVYFYSQRINDRDAEKIVRTFRINE
ncbi:hypothetical protein [Neobacillus sp. YIM B06451]|uniref:hypothetical protein n=1 Tax=Neobacillus sp. YIM B06451 TaxID=3070994 RepID=UPI00292E439A|nr:hypothetical protein [Neobacillus sp. YIM B06451]